MSTEENAEENARWLRVHMTTDYVVDLRMEDFEVADAELLWSIADGQGVFGTHPGGDLCAIPAKSIQWVEVIARRPESDQEDEQ